MWYRFVVTAHDVRISITSGLPMGSHVYLEMLRGSDVSFRLVWPGASGQPFDLTSWSVSAFEPHPLLVGNISLEITNPLQGEITGSIEWSDEYTNGSNMGFRVLISESDNQLSTPEIMVNVT